jgi:hypothetical protein
MASDDNISWIWLDITNVARDVRNGMWLEINCAKYPIDSSNIGTICEIYKVKKCKMFSRVRRNEQFGLGVV